MANTREIVKRRKSVGSIHKITRTMDMIATSRFKRAHDRAVGARPYTEKVGEMIAGLTACEVKLDHPLLTLNEDVKRTVLLVLTSNRGLCGGYNSNIVKLAQDELKALREAGHEVDLHVSGKKGISRLGFLKEPVKATYTKFDDKTNYADVEELANGFITLYVQKRIARVRVVYTRFLASSQYRPECIDLLPLAGLLSVDEEDTRDVKRKMGLHEYAFSPSGEEILEEVLPTAVRSQLYQCFSDAIVSEQTARRTAMQAASANAEQMIEALTRQYNRIRQTQITGELLDILGGAEALS